VTLPFVPQPLLAAFDNDHTMIRLGCNAALEDRVRAGHGQVIRTIRSFSLEDFAHYVVRGNDLRSIASRRRVVEPRFTAANSQHNSARPPASHLNENSPSPPSGGPYAPNHPRPASAATPHRSTARSGLSGGCASPLTRHRDR
jgi:hypothetical protein